MDRFLIKTSQIEDLDFAEAICIEMEQSAKARGTGIARRSVDYIKKKISLGDAFLVIDTEENKVAGFCYIELWSHGQYIANSGLLIFPEYRGYKLALKLKTYAFEQSRLRFPEAKLFGLTTSAAVMHINSELGYRPVTFESLTRDEDFWNGCQSCVNYASLMSKSRKNCFCTAMLFDPSRKRPNASN